MPKIYDNIVQTIGHTPLVRLNRVTEGAQATVLLKCEFSIRWGVSRIVSEWP